MKKLSGTLAIAILATRLLAQSNEPVRLALIAETDEASAASDVLTAQLSGNKQIQLLERNEIEKLYREQGLSALNKDYLKLGQILGADGLLLFDVVRTKQTTNLTARLIAVKPGVVLTDGSFSWPLKDPTSWAESVATYLYSFLPKLSVLVKDAVPISVVNLRSAVQSAEAQETERQLKLLTIQRLSRERQFFVLERQRMQLLAEEKELKADESAFWNGSYLLEGVVDQNGYSKDMITINARLTPPKGGAPLLMEVSGSRTNLAGVINRLAAKVTELLKVSSAIKEWNAADEAQQYFDEAKWALKWGVFSEAQAAADSARVLGKHDMDCAIIQIKTYAGSAKSIIIGALGSIDRSSSESDKESDRGRTINDIKWISAAYPGVVFTLSGRGIEYAAIANSPNSQNLDSVIHAMELYREFSQTLLPDEPKVDSAWYQLGIEVVTAAGQTLQHYYLVPESQKPAAEKLAQLRALARSVADWISKSPSVQDSYFAFYDNSKDDRQRMLMGRPNIFHCEIAWGCFWQEKPEDCVALYRELMRSSAFDYFMEEFCSRGLEQPRLIAWNGEDRKRIQGVWDDFVQHYGYGFNRVQNCNYNFKNLEAAGENEAEIIADYSEYRRNLKLGTREPLALERQKEYLRERRPWNMQEFDHTFSFRKYSRAQALAIKPLLDAYKADLVAQMRGNSHFENSIRLEPALRNVDRLQADVDRILGLVQVATNESATEAAVIQTPIPRTPSQTAHKTPESPLEMLTNALLVKTYLKLPTNQIPRETQLYEEMMSSLQVVGHHWGEGRLVLDLRYGCELHVNGGGGWRTKAFAGIFNPTNGNWEIITYPPAGYDDNGYPRWPNGAMPLALYRGSLYFVQDEQSILEGNRVGHKGRILKYDFKTRQWEGLKIPEQGIITTMPGLVQLSVVNDRLYAANAEEIFEITDGDKGTRILAGTRRRPAVSALDLLDNLGSPTLFSDSKNSLCAIVGNSIYTWSGTDWKKELELGFGGRREVCDEAILFRMAPLLSREPQMVWLLQKDQPRLELALYQKSTPPRKEGASPVGGNQKPTDPPPKSLWPLPGKNLLMRTAMTFFRSNLYCFVNHSLITTVDGHRTATAQNGYHAELVCLSRDCPEPIVVPLKFDLQRGPLPVEDLYIDTSNVFDASGLPRDPSQSASWMHFAGNYLFIGEEHTCGVWAIPVSEVEAAVAGQKAVLLKRAAQGN